jgi:hypothetical protein
MTRGIGMLPSEILMDFDPVTARVALADFARLDVAEMLAELERVQHMIRRTKGVGVDRVRYLRAMVNLMRTIYLLPYDLRRVLADDWARRARALSALFEEKGKNEKG